MSRWRLRGRQELEEMHNRLVGNTEHVRCVRGEQGYFDAFAGYLYAKKKEEDHLQYYYCQSYRISWHMSKLERSLMKTCGYMFTEVGRRHDHEGLPKYAVEGLRIRNRMIEVAAAAGSMEDVDRSFDAEFKRLCEKYPVCRGKWLALYAWMQTNLQCCLLTRDANCSFSSTKLSRLKRANPRMVIQSGLFLLHQVL